MGEIRELVVQYLADLAIQKARHTVISYQTALNHLDDGALADFDPVGYARKIGKLPLTPGTYNVYLAGLASFIDWLVLERDWQEAPLLQRRLRKFKKREEESLPRIPDEKDVARLFDYIRTYPVNFRGNTLLWCLRTIRDFAILEAIRSTGMRRAEAIHLLRCDVGDRCATVRKSKGGKSRVVYFDEAAWTILVPYLELTRLQGDANSAVPVFLSHQAYFLTCGIGESACHNILKKWCRLSGVKHMEWHQLRHRFGTRMLEATPNLAVVQDAMGHASPATTRIYAWVNPEEIRLAHGLARL